MSRMRFVEFRDMITEKFNQLVRETGELLFVTHVDPDELYAKYQSFFPADRNLIFRKQREHECSTCRNFIKHAGMVLAIKPDYTIDTIWNVKVPDPAYQDVADKMDMFIRSAAVDHKFVYSGRVVGCKSNFEIDSDTGDSRQWDHFYAELPRTMVTGELNTIIARSRGKAEVFERSLNMITMEAINSVLDLIEDNNLYRGLEKKSLVEKFKALKEKYEKLPEEKRSCFIWRESELAPDSVSHIKNDVIGTLLVDISSGVEMDEAVRLYEAKTAPENYRRPKPVYTQRMLDDAKKKIEELGYMSALQRRFATIDDLTINEMIFVNRNATPTNVASTGPDSLFDSMQKGLGVDPKKFRSAPTIPLTQFREEVLPNATSVELLFESALGKNMVSLIGPVDPSAKSLFQWPNPFSWAYTGNMTDSVLKQNVKNAGGDVTGDLRFSIQWNDLPDQFDQNDLDAHCIHPTGPDSSNLIYYGSKKEFRSGGELDIDIIHPKPNTPAVENITFPSRERMFPGTYLFNVHCYTNRGGRSGFRAEIEFDGQVFSYDYTNPMRQNDLIEVAKVTLSKDGRFEIEHLLKSKMGAGREIWGLTTNQFIPVTAIMESPNYWKPRDVISFDQDPTKAPDPNKKIVINYEGNPRGARHIFFMLKDCKNPEEPNPFFNEFLNGDFSDFRRVMEALGAKAHVATVDDQLSGVGFAYTQHATVVLKVDGEKVYNVTI